MGPKHVLLALILLWPSQAPGLKPRVNQSKPPRSTPDGMIWIPGGTFLMGCDDCIMPDAKPAHWVEVSGFWMDITPVTNEEYQRFVEATGYKTVAEHGLDPRDFPGVAPEDLVPGSTVFSPRGFTFLENPLDWWAYLPGASWMRPEGPNSHIQVRSSHPVVHVAYADAEIYCTWMEKRLPTEAEYEFAARGGLHAKRYSWGDKLKPEGRWPANIWQGEFPMVNTKADGYERTSPVRAFPPNGFGLYDMAGNVWQWCSDWYRADYYAKLAQTATVTWNPTGPKMSLDPLEPGVKKRVQKGGSFLCSDTYCSRFLVGSRGRGAIDSGSSNVGFRCVRSL